MCVCVCVCVCVYVYVYSENKFIFNNRYMSVDYIMEVLTSIIITGQYISSLCPAYVYTYF